MHCCPLWPAIRTCTPGLPNRHNHPAPHAPPPDCTAPYRSVPAVYCEDFEAPFLERTAEFYRAEAADFIASCDCPAYLAHAERRLGEEGDRVGAMLDASTELKVVKVGKPWLYKRGYMVACATVAREAAAVNKCRLWRTLAAPAPVVNPAACPPACLPAPPACLPAGGGGRACEPADVCASGHGEQRHGAHAAAGQGG